jgi:hypothetical protein
MLASIHPLGERSRGQRFGTTVGAYLLASTLGGTALGLALGALGGLVGGEVATNVRIGLLAVAAAVAAGWEVTRRPVPSWHRQVNEDWLADLRGWIYGAGFGAQLGTGVVTIVTTAAVYLVWLAALLGASPALGGAIGATFGLSRALPVLTSWRADRPDRVAARVRALDARAGSFRTVTILAELLAAALLVGVLA